MPPPCLPPRCPRELTSRDGTEKPHRKQTRSGASHPRARQGRVTNPLGTAWAGTCPQPQPARDGFAHPPAAEGGRSWQGRRCASAEGQCRKQEALWLAPGSEIRGGKLAGGRFPLAPWGRGAGGARGDAGAPVSPSCVRSGSGSGHPRRSKGAGFSPWPSQIYPCCVLPAQTGTCWQLERAITQPSTLPAASCSHFLVAWCTPAAPGC